MTSIDTPRIKSGAVVGHDENQHYLGDSAFSSLRELFALLDDCLAILSLRSVA